MVQLPSFLGVTADQMTMPVQGTYGVRNGMDDRPMMDPDWAANIAVLQNFLYTDMTAEEAIAAGGGYRDAEGTWLPVPLPRKRLTVRKPLCPKPWKCRAKRMTPSTPT